MKISNMFAIIFICYCTYDLGTKIMSAIKIIILLSNK